LPSQRSSFVYKYYTATSGNISSYYQKYSRQDNPGLSCRLYFGALLFHACQFRQLSQAGPLPVHQDTEAIDARGNPGADHDGNQH